MKQLKFIGWLLILICLAVSIWQFSGKVSGDSSDVPINALCLDQVLPKDGKVGYIAAEESNPAEYMRLQYYLVPRVFEQRYSSDDCAGLEWVVTRDLSPDEIDSIAADCEMQPVAECGSEVVLRRED